MSVTPKQDSVDSLPVHEITRIEIGVVVYPGFVGLDLVGILAYVDLTSSTLPLAVNINIIAATMKPVPASAPPTSQGKNNGVIWVPRYTFTSPPPKIDILIIPGKSDANLPIAHDAIVSFISHVYTNAMRLITVGTGAALVAEAGILTDRKATTSKALITNANAYSNVIWTSGR